MKTQKIQKNQNNQNNMKQNETRIIENRRKLISNSSFSNQLAIPKMISQQMTKFSPYQTRYIGDDRFKFESMNAENYASNIDSTKDLMNKKMIKQNNSLININVIQKRRKRKTQKNMNLF